MESTPATQGTAPDAPWGRNRRLLAYCVGFVLLTNLLTVVFVFLLRRSASTPVMIERVQPASQDGQEPAHARGETRPVRVTSRPDGALVTYQGQAQGTTPLEVALPAHAGGALEITKDGYRTRTVKVAADQDAVHVRLVRSRERARDTGRDTDSPAPAPKAEGASAGEAGEASAGEASAGEAGQGSPAAESAARTPAAHRPARTGARRTSVSDNPDPWKSGERSKATANPDPWAE